MINFTLNNVISFGKTPVASFKVSKTTKDGFVKTIPVQVSKLDNKKDYDDYFQPEKLKKINMRTFFEDRSEPIPDEYDYIIEKKTDGKLLGAAICSKSALQPHMLLLDVIGTHVDKKYHGLGRALLAGIVMDNREKYTEVAVPTPIPSAYKFYDKCHFYKSDYEFYLDEDYYDILIDDAQNLIKK